MAKIGLSAGFTVIPEGEHIFKIIGVTYKEKFGKLEVKLQTVTGLTHTERYSLLTQNGSPNEGALNAFSYMARVAMGNSDLTEIDHEDLVGHFIKCTVEHDIQPNKNKPGQTVTFVRLTDKSSADGFEPMAESATPANKSESGFDLDALLGV